MTHQGKTDQFLKILGRFIELKIIKENESLRLVSSVKVKIAKKEKTARKS